MGICARHLYTVEVFDRNDVYNVFIVCYGFVCTEDVNYILVKMKSLILSTVSLVAAQIPLLLSVLWSKRGVSLNISCRFRTHLRWWHRVAKELQQYHLEAKQVICYPR